MKQHDARAAAPTSHPIQVLLADDHAVLRSGLRKLLDAEPDLHVIGEAATGEEAVEKARALQPDVVIMDLVMPGMGGLEALRRIAKQERSAKILVLTGKPKEQVLLDVLEAGGSGYVNKMSSSGDLARAIRSVVRHEVFVDRGVTKALVQRSGRTPRQQAGAALGRLSAREREVLALTAAGHTSTEIGAQLKVSPKTVETYRSRIMAKLGFEHRSEVVRFALRTGLLRVE
ncbi:MAG: DNA-binding response regulator [Gemmatimonadetes bacterium]|nr:MAG: DNA-binding response regulator [Gemmatimonadota bacterium]